MREGAGRGRLELTMGTGGLGSGLGGILLLASFSSLSVMTLNTALPICAWLSRKGFPESFETH
jgi:hypothetical protein